MRARLLLAVPLFCLPLACAPAGDDGGGDGGGDTTGGGSDAGQPVVTTTDVTLENPSGEDNTLEPGGSVAFTNSVAFGTFQVLLARPTTNSFDTVEPLPAPAGGNAAFSLNSANAYGEGGFWLGSSETAKFDDEYELTVAVGLRKEVTAPLLVAVGFWGTTAAGDESIHPLSRIVVEGLVTGQWKDVTTTFRVPREFDGQTITAGAWMRANARATVFFDNFRLKRRRADTTVPALPTVMNASFEYPVLAGTRDYSFNALGWAKAAGLGSHFGVSRHTSPAAANGSQYLEMDTNMTIRTTVNNLTFGNTYLASAKFHLRPGYVGSRVGISVLDAYNAVDADESGWKTASVCFTMPAAEEGTAGPLFVDLVGDAMTQQRVLVDDVKVEEVSGCD